SGHRCRQNVFGIDPRAASGVASSRGCVTSRTVAAACCWTEVYGFTLRFASRTRLPTGWVSDSTRSCRTKSILHVLRSQETVACPGTVKSFRSDGTWNDRPIVSRLSQNVQDVPGTVRSDLGRSGEDAGVARGGALRLAIAAQHFLALAGAGKFFAEAFEAG